MLLVNHVAGFLIVNISGKSGSISFVFCMEILTMERKHLGLLLMVQCGHAFPDMIKLPYTCCKCFCVVLGYGQIKNINIRLKDQLIS